MSIGELAHDEIALSADDLAGLTDAELIDRITALERRKRSISAEQARLSVAFDASQRRQQVDAGVPRHKVGRGVSDQIALARMESPHRGGRHLGLATALVREMPCTFAALERGDVSEWGATVVARETAVLTLEQRREVDVRLAATMAQQGVSEKQLGDRARAIAYELDAESAVRRNAKAESERRVTLRPAPDTMTYLTALVPVQGGVGVLAVLDRVAKQAAAQGDPRTRGQVMADALVALVTGTAGNTATAGNTGTTEGDEAPPGPEVPIPRTPAVTVNLVMSALSLFGGDDTSAVVCGYGPVPAQIARRLVASAAEADAAWVRRLYRHPDGSELVAMDSRSRLFPSGLAAMIRLGDQVCATPWCDAPIRHTDHVRPWARGGETSFRNGQGLCEHCNLVKEDAGFATERDGPRTTITTPTGHRYSGTAPPLPGVPPAADPDDTPTTSPVERWMRRAVSAA